jgi:hypothetical protein
MPIFIVPLPDAPAIARTASPVIPFWSYQI